MGIQNLTKLVSSVDGVYQDVEFRDSTLVIDGSNLVYHLYFDTGLDQNLGGEYGAFKNVVTKFIEALRKCHIRPFVVFDGCSDLSDQKCDTERERAEQRVQQAVKAAETGTPKGVLPTLIWEVFRQTLEGLKVPLARSYTEADREVAALAQEWGCPVLSNDTDFFIFPLSRGMLPITHFRWQEVVQSKGRSVIRCKEYLASRFCAAKNVSIRTELLPVFAVLAGNDYTRNRFGTSDTKYGQQQQASHTKLHYLCKWIRSLEDAAPRTVLQTFLTEFCLKKQKVSISDLEEAAALYSLPRSSLREFFDEGTLPPLPEQMEVPDWMRRPVTEAQFSSDFLDVLIHRRVGLSVMVDRQDKPSANQVSLHLRKVLYSLLLGADRKVEERDRDGLRVKLNKVQTDVSLSKHLKLQDLPQTEVEQRKQVLLEALGVSEQSLSSLPSDLTEMALPVAATCFWNKTVGPPVELLQGLMIFWCKEDIPQQPAVSVQGVDDWRHWCNQWQSCLRDTFLLNQLLGNPLPEPPMARLFSGTFVHGIRSRGLHTSDNNLNTLLKIVQQTGSAPEAAAQDQGESSRGTNRQNLKRPKTTNHGPGKSKSKKR